MAEYFAVTFTGSDTVVSVVTKAYRELIAGRAPEFYEPFVFHPFESPRTFTELNAMLPLRRGTETAPAYLTEWERLHLEAHREILRVYRELGLPPLPPWDLREPRLAAPLSRLEESARRFMDEGRVD